VYFDETGFRNDFSEPVTAIRAYIERLKYVHRVIVVITLFKVPRMKLVRHEKSTADLLLKVYSFQHFRLDRNRGLTLM